MKATHNGTCQACGRSQAHAGSMAKHGYTVETGYFSGTCSGSDREALELDTAHNIATVAYIREWADEQDVRAAGEIIKVFVSVPNPDYCWGRNRRIDVAMDREEFVAKTMTKYTHTTDAETLESLAGYASKDFDDAVQRIRDSLRRDAESARKDADNLEVLRDKTFGNELEARETETTLHREDFTATGPRLAYIRQAKLAEQGIKATVRRNKYREITLTYRK